MIHSLIGMVIKDQVIIGNVKVEVVSVGVMKFKKKGKCSKAHHFIVDKSLGFAICSVCGVYKKRVSVSWGTRNG